MNVETRPIAATGSGAGRLAVLSLLVSEAAGAAALLQLLLQNAGRDARLGVPATFALIAVSFTVWQLALFGRPLRSIRRALAHLAGIAMALYAVSALLYPSQHFVSLPSNLWHELTLIIRAFPFGPVLLSVALFVCWRGGRLAAAGVAFRSAAVSFQVGAALLLAVYAFAALANVLIPYALPLAAVFFCAGLFAVALSHLQATASASGQPSVVAGDHKQVAALAQRQWLWLLVASVVLTLALGILVALFLDERALRLLLVPVYWAGDAFGALMTLLTRLFPPPAHSELPGGLQAPALASAEEAERRSIILLPEYVRDLGRFAWALIFFGLIAAAAYRLLADVVAHLFRISPVANNATVERISGAWRSDLRALLRLPRQLVARLIEDCQWLVHRWRRAEPAASSRAVASVRSVYRDLLYWSAKRGLPRLPGETPYEYLRRLAAGFPAAAPGLRLLTECYVIARYAPDDLVEADSRRATNTWRQLRGQLRRQPVR